MDKIDFNDTQLSELDKAQMQKLVGRRALFEPRFPGKPLEAIIKKVSPPGDRIKIRWQTRSSATWTEVRNIKFLEVLDQPKRVMRDIGDVRELSH